MADRPTFDVPAPPGGWGTTTISVPSAEEQRNDGQAALRILAAGPPTT
ncbi:hypothetical protein [Isoptericola chiayiensis]|nr:hypothetical protein [Isoptericola chiayiensis]NOW00936.1 hypothetical protein [Isoptericola chiayiensis]